ncbi:hypothetical protein F4826_004758 [Rahnella inusitata]|nr:hypothetical protein [Rahnella inusitata]
MNKRVAGEENSVTLAFHQELFEVAAAVGKSELVMMLNGSDRNVNADAIFGANDRFLIVESKSFQSSIKDEGRKDSASNLCLSLQADPYIEALHVNCHFIIWDNNIPNVPIVTEYSSYQNAVCRPEVLPNCIGLKSPPNSWSGRGKILATNVVTQNIGLGKPDFFYYLEWLFNVRHGRAAGTQLPVTLLATSFAGGVTSVRFDSVAAFANWTFPSSRYQLALNPSPGRGPHP